MEVEGCGGVIDTERSGSTLYVPTISLRLAVVNVFWGFFYPDVAVFGPKQQFLKLRSATRELFSGRHR